jgi:hypothetical protein
VLMLILLIFIISSLTRCSCSKHADEPQTSAKAPMQVVVQPPPTYVE